MLRGVLALFAWTALSWVAAAGAMAGGEAAPTGPALTALAAGPLGRSTHIAVATLQSQHDAREVRFVRLKVERWLRGHRDGADISVLVGGPGPTADPSQPSAPLLGGRAGTSYLLFLSQRTAGVAFALEGRIPLSGLEADEKVAAVEAQIALAAIPDPEERARLVLVHFVQALTSAGAWTRSNAARELNHLATVRPQVFTAAARTRIERLAEAPGTAPTVKTWLRSLLTVLGPDTFVGPTAPPPAATEPTLPAAPAVSSRSATPAERIVLLDAELTRSGEDAARRALYLVRNTPEPAVRAWLVDWLAESGHASALPALRTAYGREDEPEVREALVRAVGLLGGDADVPWLVERLGSARLVDAAVLALARVRSPAALEALRIHQKKCAGGSEEERDLAARIDHLLSPAFEAAEQPGHRVAPTHEAPPR